MSLKTLIEYQLLQIKQGGHEVLFIKMKRVLKQVPRLPLFIPAIPAVLVIRLIRPWLLVRLGGLMNSRIGHFVGNTEMYLCERDAGINVPKQRYVDLFYMSYGYNCNQQLATMWKRILHIWPFWILYPINLVNRMIPGGEIHEIPNNTQHDKDVHNLLDRFAPHLYFIPEEESIGENRLREMGLSKGTSFVCLITRDEAYLDTYQAGDWNYHSYRNCSINNYILAAEELAERGYVVIRLGAKVNEPMRVEHPLIIDYAINGMRSDFMDIYLGAKCEFCIVGGSGYGSVPTWGFRRPTLFTDILPVGYAPTFSDKFILTVKMHILSSQHRELTMREIFDYDAGFCLHTSEYESKGIELIESSPEEIRDVVIEMAERLAGIWQPHPDDKALQKRFWEIFPTDAVKDDSEGKPLHGEIRARFGAHFLRNNRDWLE
jgi:putative glycosyltransferase (TIGR04372 family)